MYKANQSVQTLFLFYILLATTNCQLFPEKNKQEAVQVEEIGKPLKPIDPGKEPAFTFNGVTPAVKTTYSKVTNLMISNKSFSSLTGNDLDLKNCRNVVISNCYFGLAPSGTGVRMQDCSNITIVNCFFANTAVGTWLTSCNGPINISNNQFLNINGKISSYAYPHAIILDKCNGSGILVNKNYIESFCGENNINDQINLFQSNGTPTGPIIVSNNIMRGGGPNNSGTGIIAGDGGNSSYQNIIGNICVNTGAVGIAAAGGHHITLNNNQVYGLPKTISNVGMYIWNQYKTECNNISGSGNKINWKKSDGSTNNFWNGHGNCTLQNWDGTNLYGQTLGSMHVPDYLFTIPVDTFWYIRKIGFPYTSYLDIARPSSDAGSTQNIVGTSTTLDGSKSTSSNGLNYHWSIARGPSGASIANADAATTLISGLANGTYHIRLVVADNGNRHGTDTTYDVSWVDINVSGAGNVKPAAPTAGPASPQTTNMHNNPLNPASQPATISLNKYAWIRRLQDSVSVN